MTPAPKTEKTVKTKPIKSRLMGLAASRPKNKSKKVQPAVQRKKLIAGLDLLWSKIVHKRWGEKCGWPGCANCGNLSAHHFLGKKAYGMKARYELNNGILLCFYHHIGRVHQQGDTEPVRAEIIKRIGLGKFERMVAEVREVWKPTIEELLELKERLSTELEAK